MNASAEPLPFPSPTEPIANRAEVFVRYLDYFRSRLLHAVETMPAAELRTSRLPSGWTPLQLIVHLRHVEQRWLVWGFEGAQVLEPWGDQQAGRWYVSDDADPADLVADLRAQGERTRAVIAANDLDAIGRPGPRWDGAPPASLERVLFHLLQEYARHVGHLDIVAELAGTPLGE